MYKQVEKFRVSTAADRNDTYKVSLPKAGILSYLYLDLVAQQTGTTPFQTATDGKWRLLDFLDNISVVVNGRASIVNVPGDMLEFKQYLDQGITAFNKEREYSNSYQNARMLINFGDYMWDKSRALDCGDYDDVELQIKNTLSTSQWADSLKVTCLLGWMRDHTLPGDKSFWQYELWRTITTVADGWTYLTLPSGKRVRRVVLQVKPARDATYGVNKTYPRNVADEIQLQYKNGAYSVFDDDIEELWHQNYLELGFENFVHGHVYHQNGYGFDVGLGEVRGSALGGTAAGTTKASNVPSREGDQDATTQHLYSYEADHVTDFVFRGAGYQSCGCFQFGEYGQDSDLLDPSKNGYGDVLLNIHCKNDANAASGTVKVALDRLANPQTLAA